MKRRLHDGDTLSAVEGDFEDSPHRDCGPDADRARIGYADFVAICHVDNPKDFGGFRVEANGLYVNLPPADATLTPEERAAVTWHPTGQYDKPALPLPCTLGQLRAFLPDAGMAGSIDEESVAALLGGREYMAGWYNETLDAEMWFGLASPTPHEAAMLLCQHNPHENACDPMKTTTDETGPEDFKRLLRVFEDLEKVEPKARTLRQWLAIARDKGLKYHSWIDAYVMAQIEELTADTGGTAKVGAGTAAATPSLTEIRIAAIVQTATQLKYDPLSVATGGKAIIEAECLDKLKGAPHRFTADTFKKAWQAARDAGQIDVENVEIYRGQ